MSDEASKLPDIDPLYQKGAEAIYTSYREASTEAQKVAAGYGKWLISSVLLLHAGAIAGLFTFMGTLITRPEFDAVPYAAAVWWFVYGIMAILVCGFVTWVNWTLVAISNDHYVKPWMLVDPKEFPKDVAKGGWAIILTFWLPIIFGIISLACMLRGAHMVSKALGA